MRNHKIAMFWTDQDQPFYGYIRQELQRGRLRQGWGPPGSSLKFGNKAVPFNQWEKGYLKGGSQSWNKSEAVLRKEEDPLKRHKLLCQMLRLTPGDLVVVPHMPSREEFTIAKIANGYVFVESDFQPREKGPDYGHVVLIDRNNLVTIRYDSDDKAKLIERMNRFYRSPIRFVEKTDYLNAIEELWHAGNTSDSDEQPPDEADKSEGEPPEKKNHRRTWSGPECEWHKSKVTEIAQNPNCIGLEKQLVKRTWANKCISDDGRKLWGNLRSQKRPDVVFELKSGEMVIVEVEPFATYLDGLAQLLGDYKTAMLVDRGVDGNSVPIRTVLVVDSNLDKVRTDAQRLFGDQGLEI